MHFTIINIKSWTIKGGNMNITKKTIIFGLIIFLLLVPIHPSNAASTSKDFSAPSVPESLSVVNKTCTSLMISWEASTDNTGVRGYHVYRDGRKLITISKTSYTNNDLIPGREYTYMIRAYDSSGNVSDGSLPLEISTLNDSQPPTVPEGITATNISYTSVTLSWTPSADNTSLRGYEVYCNGSKKASTSATTYTCKSLTPGETHTFYIKAYDIAGNSSNESRKVTCSTLSDTEAPSVPTGLKITEVTGTDIELEWSASIDNVKVKGYEIYCNGEQIGKASKPPYKCKNLIPGASYKLEIRAYDASGNVSTVSGTLGVTTTRDSGAPSTPECLKIKSVKGNSISLSWNESEDDIKVKGYKIYCNGLQIATSVDNRRTIKLSKSILIGIIYVRAYDLMGNLSASSNKVTVVM